MKFFLTIIVFLSVANDSFAQVQGTSGFTIAGHINGIPDTSEMYLIRSVSNRADTVKIFFPVSSTFSIQRDSVDGAEFYWIKVKGQDGYITLFLDNSNVSISGTYSDWPVMHISGSSAHSEFQVFENMSSGVSKIDSLRENFIGNHFSSYYSSVLLLYQTGWNAGKRLEYYSKLDKKVQLSKYGKELLAEVQLQQIQEKIKKGNRLPDLFSKNTVGDSVSLLAAVGTSDFTLIDFWASWCAPCKKELPHLKQVYSDFHDKGFNIISISLDTKKELWEKAIESENLPWPQFSELKGRDESIAKILAVNGIPASILIDKTGQIIELDLPGSVVASNTGSLRGKLLYTKVEELTRRK